MGIIGSHLDLTSECRGHQAKRRPIASMGREIGLDCPLLGQRGSNCVYEVNRLLKNRVPNPPRDAYYHGGCRMVASDLGHVLDPWSRWRRGGRHRLRHFCASVMWCDR
jgi:hypothetical protein